MLSRVPKAWWKYGGITMPRRTNRQQWIDLTEILTPNGIEALKAGKDIGINVGQVLKFDYEGSANNLKLMRLDRKRGRVWAKEVRLYTPDELEAVDKPMSFGPRPEPTDPKYLGPYEPGKEEV